MKQPRIISFFLLLFFLSVSGMGLAQNHATTIKVQAMQMARALSKNDLDSFLLYIPDEIINYAGGKDTMKSRLDSASSAMKKFGARISRISIGNPGKIIQYKKQLQSVLPQTTTITTLLGDMVAETTLIAISTDKGKTWKFIDTNIYKVDKVKGVLPGLSPELVIPPQKKPEFKPKTED